MEDDIFKGMKILNSNQRCQRNALAAQFENT